MAGIEKICEVCGTHCSYDMYRYKRDLIQVCPECRKTFKGKQVKFVIESTEYYWVHKRQGYYTSSDMSYRSDYRRRKEYIYYIELDDGTRFYNWSFELKSTIRRIKRMVGGSKYFTRGEFNHESKS